MPTRSPNRAVKKKNGLSSVDGATFSGNEAKKSSVRLAGHQGRGGGVERAVRRLQDAKTLGLKPRTRALLFGRGEGVGPGNHGDDVADVERDHMVLQRGGGHALALQRVGGDRDQPIEFAAVTDSNPDFGYNRQGQ